MDIRKIVGRSQNRVIGHFIFIQPIQTCCECTRIEDRETYICFLRRQSAPGVPFYTIEVEPGGTIRQHRSYLDEEPGIEEIRGFLREWQKVLKSRLTWKDRELARTSKIKREQNIEELKAKRNIRVLKGLEEDFLEAEAAGWN